MVQVELDKDGLHTVGQDDYDYSTIGNNPMVTLDLEDGRYIEVCHENHSGSKADQFFSVMLCCSNDEYNGGYFHHTLGVIGKLNYDTIEEVNEKGIPSLTKADKEIPYSIKKN